jgi:hypothetical protein
MDSQDTPLLPILLHNQDVAPDIWYCTPDVLPRPPLRPRPREHPHEQRADWPVARLRLRPQLRHVRELVRLALLEDVHVVAAHLLLGNEHFLAPVDDEVAPLVVRALAQLGQLLVGELVQGAVAGPEHDGHLFRGVGKALAIKGPATSAGDLRMISGSTNKGDGGVDLASVTLLDPLLRSWHRVQ